MASPGSRNPNFAAWRDVVLPLTAPLTQSHSRQAAPVTANVDAESRTVRAHPCLSTSASAAAVGPVPFSTAALSSLSKSLAFPSVRKTLALKWAP